LSDTVSTSRSLADRKCSVPGATFKGRGGELDSCREQPAGKSVFTPSLISESTLDTMIQLAQVGKSHRVVVAGAASLDIHRGLYRRGFVRVTALVDSAVSHIQHDAALVAGQHSIKALEALLVRAVSRLHAQGTIAVWVDSVGGQRGKPIQLALQRLAFHIQSGAKCETGFVVAARRNDCLANAA
jgi:hypothetical protein